MRRLLTPRRSRAELARLRHLTTADRAAVEVAETAPKASPETRAFALSMLGVLAGAGFAVGVLARLL